MKHIGQILSETLSATRNGTRYTPLDREFWVRPCPWCGETLEPTKIEDDTLRSGYWWRSGLIGHSCPGYEEEKLEQAKRLAVHEAQKREERWNTICARAGLTERRLQMTFESFERHKQPEAYDAAENFFTERQSLIFCGPRGTGKTHLASAILQRWLRKGFEKEIEEPSAIHAGGRGFFITLPELLLRIQASYKQRYTTQTEHAIIEYLTKVPLLVLDDVGKEKSSEFSRRTIFNLIDGCYVRRGRVIITSNDSDRDLAKALGGASYSRMLEMGQIVTMHDEYDYRQQMSAARRVKG